VKPGWIFNIITRVVVVAAAAVVVKRSSLATQASL